METPHNSFKQALALGRTQLGLWLALGDTCSAEICAAGGFDWVLVDAEHGPHDQRSVLAHLQALGAHPRCNPVVRVPSSDAVMIKQFLDLGAQTILVPMVGSAEEAARAVRASRYPPDGIRGVGGARASGWGRYTGYVQGDANTQVCVLVQIETGEGLANLEEIADVDGVNGLFVGASDLSASLGFPGNSRHPKMQATIAETFERIRATGKPSGALAIEEIAAHEYLASGVTFVALGIDTMLLAKETTRLVSMFARYREPSPEVALASELT